MSEKDGADENKSAITDGQQPSPLDGANFFSRLFFWWLNPLFTLGSKRPLEVDDLHRVPPIDKTEHLADQLSLEWEKEIAKRKTGGKPRLGRAIIRTFWRPFFTCGFIAFVEEFFKVLQPVLLGFLITYFSPDSPMPRWEAVCYALGVGGCAIMLAITHHPYFFGVQRIGMWVRVSASSLVYNKLLRLSHRAFADTTTGQIVNLLSNDVVRFDFVPMFLHYLWIGPLQALFVLVYLWYLFGPSTLASFFVLLALMPVQGTMGRLFTKLRLKVAVETDERVRLMDEILNSMRIIKMYCWEHLFSDLVKKVRRREHTAILCSASAKIITQIVIQNGGRLMVGALVLAQFLSYQPLMPGYIFPAACFLNILRGTIFTRLTTAITSWGESKSTIARLKVKTWLVLRSHQQLCPFPDWMLELNSDWLCRRFPDWLHLLDSNFP